jgi:hypothetical protein
MQCGHDAVSAAQQEETMIRNFTISMLIGALIGAIALGLFERSRASVESAAQLPAELAFPVASLRDMFP